MVVGQFNKVTFSKGGYLLCLWAAMVLGNKGNFLLRRHQSFQPKLEYLRRGGSHHFLFELSKELGYLSAGMMMDMDRGYSVF